MNGKRPARKYKHITSGLLLNRAVQTHDELEQWGAWASVSGISLNVKSQFFAGGATCWQISDDRARLLDFCVAQLGIQDPIAQSIMCEHFVSGKTYREIEAIVGVKRSQVGGIKDSAVAWIDGLLINPKFTDQVSKRFNIEIMKKIS